VLGDELPAIRSLLLIGDPKNDFAARAPRAASFERGPDVVEREHRVDCGTQAAGIDEVGQLGKLTAVRLDDEVDGSDAVGRLLGNRDDPAARTQQGWGAGEQVPARRVEDEIDRLEHVLEVCRALEHLVRPEAARTVEVSSRDCGDHVGAAPEGRAVPRGDRHRRRRR
jgi:hypothetical protein